MINLHPFRFRIFRNEVVPDHLGRYRESRQLREDSTKWAQSSAEHDPAPDPPGTYYGALDLSIEAIFIIAALLSVWAVQ